MLERHGPLQRLSRGNAPQGCLGTPAHTHAHSQLTRIPGWGLDPANPPPILREAPGAGAAGPSEPSLLGRVGTPGAGAGLIRTKPRSALQGGRAGLRERGWGSSPRCPRLPGAGATGEALQRVLLASLGMMVSLSSYKLQKLRKTEK